MGYMCKVNKLIVQLTSVIHVTCRVVLVLVWNTENNCFFNVGFNALVVLSFPGNEYWGCKTPARDVCSSFHKSVLVSSGILFLESIQFQKFRAIWKSFIESLPWKIWFICNWTLMFGWQHPFMLLARLVQYVINDSLSVLWHVRIKLYVTLSWLQCSPTSQKFYHLG